MTDPGSVLVCSRKSTGLLRRCRRWASGLVESFRRHPADVVLSVALLFLIAALMAQALLAPPREKITIATTQGVEGAALKKLAEEFSAEQGIPVEVVDWPYDELFGEENSDLSISMSPRYDVILLDDPWLPALNRPRTDSNPRLFPLSGSKSDKNLLGDAGGPCPIPGDFIQPTLDVCHDVNDPNTYYAIPFVGNSQLFCYNKRFRSSVPSTWEELLDENVRTTTAAGKAAGRHLVDGASRSDSEPPELGYITRVGQSNSIVTDFIPVIWHYCQSGWCDDKFILDPCVKNAFQFLTSLGERDRRKGNGDLAIVAPEDFDLAVQLKKGKASMGIVWAAWAMAMEGTREEGQGLADLAYVEDMPGGVKPLLGAWLLAVPRRSEHAAEAMSFILFATNPVNMKRAATWGNPPPRKHVFEDTDLRNSFVKTFDHQLCSLQNSQPRPRTAHWREIERTLGSILSDLYAGVIKPDEALSRVNAKIRKITEERPNAPPAPSQGAELR